MNAANAASTGRPPLARVPLLLLGFVALFSATAAGLARLGWPAAEGAAAWGALHGPLMICGFFGVVISLERAVAIGQRWAYAGALLAGLGSAAALLGALAVTPWLYAAASVWLLAAALQVVRRQRALFTVTMALGAACWLVGNGLWLRGAAVYQVMPWWLSFLILTIAGERLDLSRLMPPSRPARVVFVLLLVAIIAGLVASGTAPGGRLFGGALTGLALWLLRQDIARRTVRQQGLTRFIAVCLLSGYVWLGVGGLAFALAAPVHPGNVFHDAAVHAIGLGFVFAMVFGHAPIIFPAVLRVTIAYHPVFYGPLLLLHASMLLRLAGDATWSFAAVRWGGLLNALALAAFIVGTAVAAWRGTRARLPGDDQSSSA